MKRWIPLLLCCATLVGAEDIAPAGPILLPGGGPGVAPGKDPAAKPDSKPAADKKEADTEKSVEPPLPPADEVHRVTLKSGTVLVGQLAPAEWTIKTNFGQLRVPVKQVKRVIFGRAADPELQKTVALWIDELGATASSRRKRAIANLEREGPFAIAAIEAAAKKHTDPAVKSACAELADSLSIEDDDRVHDSDLIVTTAFTFQGQLEPQSFQVRVKELGVLNVKRSDIRTISEVAHVNAVKFKLTAQHSARYQWFDTKRKFKSGQKLRIEATGTIVFPTWGNNSFVPDGNRNLGSFGNHPNGTLVGRFGNGTWFRIGSSFTGKANGTGTLQLAVVSSLGNNMQHTGEYVITLHLSDR